MHYPFTVKKKNLDALKLVVIAALFMIKVRGLQKSRFIVTEDTCHEFYPRTD